MAEILTKDDLGRAADPADPADLARALAEVLDQPAADLAAMRGRCLAVTRDRYNWETAVGPYLAVVEALAPTRG